MARRSMCSTSTEAFLGAAEELLGAANGSSGGGSGKTSTPRAVRIARAPGKGGEACTSTPPAVVQQRRTARVGYGGGVPQALACDAAGRRKYLKRRASALRRGACALCLKKARAGATVPGSSGARALGVYDNCAAGVHVQCYSDARHTGVAAAGCWRRWRAICGWGGRWAGHDRSCCLAPCWPRAGGASWWARARCPRARWRRHGCLQLRPLQQRAQHGARQLVHGAGPCTLAWVAAQARGGGRCPLRPHPQPARVARAWATGGAVAWHAVQMCAFVPGCPPGAQNCGPRTACCAVAWAAAHICAPRLRRVRANAALHRAMPPNKPRLRPDHCQQPARFSLLGQWARHGNHRGVHVPGRVRAPRLHGHGRTCASRRPCPGLRGVVVSERAEIEQGPAHFVVSLHAEGLAAAWGGGAVHAGRRERAFAPHDAFMPAARCAAIAVARGGSWPCCSAKVHPGGHRCVGVLAAATQPWFANPASVFADWMAKLANGRDTIAKCANTFAN